MKLTKVISAIAAGVLTVSMLAINTSAATVFDGLASGELAAIANTDDSGTLMQAGAPTKSFVDGKGLKVSSRVNDYDSVDFKLAGLAAGDYTIEVTFTSAGEDNFQIGEADSPWGSLTEAAGSEVTLTHAFTVDGEGKSNGQAKFRLRAVSLNDFTIANIVVYDADGPDAAAPAPEAGGDEGTTSPVTGNAPIAVTVTVMALAGAAAVAAKKRK